MSLGRCIAAATAAAGRAVALNRASVPARRLNTSILTLVPAALGPAAVPFGPRGFAGSSEAAGQEGAGGSTPSRTWEAPPDRRELDHSGRGIQAELVEKYLSEACMSNKEINQAKLSSVRAEYARHELDCGSTEVQVAALTTRIKQMIEHRSTHRKDHVSNRSLQAMLNQRRKLLRYLRRTNGDRYGELIFQLGLRDNVVPVQGFQRNARAK